MHNQCDSDLDTSILLTPLQWACDLLGAPIPAEAIQNAENEASTFAAEATKTVTMSVASGSASGGVEATATVEEAGSITIVTVTTTQAGTIIALAYPVTEWNTTTISGSPSIVTEISDAG